MKPDQVLLFTAFLPICLPIWERPGLVCHSSAGLPGGISLSRRRQAFLAHFFSLGNDHKELQDETKRAIRRSLLLQVLLTVHVGHAGDV